MRFSNFVLSVKFAVLPNYNVLCEKIAMWVKQCTRFGVYGWSIEVTLGCQKFGHKRATEELYLYRTLSISFEGVLECRILVEQFVAFFR